MESELDVSTLSKEDLTLLWGLFGYKPNDLLLFGGIKVQDWIDLGFGPYQYWQWDAIGCACPQPIKILMENGITIDKASIKIDKYLAKRFDIRLPFWFENQEPSMGLLFSLHRISIEKIKTVIQVLSSGYVSEFIIETDTFPLPQLGSRYTNGEYIVSLQIIGQKTQIIPSLDDNYQPLVSKTASIKYRLCTAPSLPVIGDENFQKGDTPERVNLRDPQVLSAIDPSNIAGYLKQTGWINTFDIKDNSEIRASGWTLFKENKGREHDDFCHTILLPANNTIKDFPYRVSDILKTLSEIEGRSKLDIYESFKAFANYRKIEG